MIVKTGRFGQLNVDEADIVKIPQGILGFPAETEYCLVDPGDETLILWLQALANPLLAFPVLEPKIFKTDYKVRLSGLELRELKLETITSAAVLSILTIPDDITQMTANLKAPLVINLKDSLGKQVILQENEYNVRHAMFKELRTHLLTIHAQKKNQQSYVETEVKLVEKTLVKVNSLQPSEAVQSLTI